jgi:hypothetical protein
MSLLDFGISAPCEINGDDKLFLIPQEKLVGVALVRLCHLVDTHNTRLMEQNTQLIKQTEHMAEQNAILADRNTLLAEQNELLSLDLETELGGLSAVLIEAYKDEEDEDESDEAPAPTPEAG